MLAPTHRLLQPCVMAFLVVVYVGCFKSNQNPMSEAERLYQEGTAQLESDPAQAIEALSKSLALNPDAPPALYNRAAAYARLGRDAEAIADVERLETVAPEIGAKLRAKFRLSAGGYTSIAEGEYQANRFEAAIRKCDTALTYNPQWGDAFVIKGLAFTKLDQCQEALACFDKGAEVEPDNYFVYINRAELHEKEGRLQQALADFSKSIELEPKNPAGYTGRARVYSAMNRKDKAAADEAKAAELKASAKKQGE